MATVKDLEVWVQRDIVRFGKAETVIEQVPWTRGDTHDWKFRVYTDVHRFSIAAYDPSVLKPSGYLGCIATCRKPRAGEDWTRGSDLADGTLDEATWHRILGDIVSYELVKVHRPKAAANTTADALPWSNTASGAVTL